VHQKHLENTIFEDRARVVFACMVCAILIAGPFAAAWVNAFVNRSSGHLSVASKDEQESLPMTEVGRGDDDDD
jgi:hypothetical protein